MLLFKLAFRNLKEHWVKTLILGIIIFNSVFVLVVGESFLGNAQAGIRKTFVDNFTGDVIVKAQAIYPYSIFGVQSPGGIEDNPTLPDLIKIRDYLLSDNGNAIESFSMLATSFALIRIEGQKNLDARGMTFLFGIDADSYFATFPDRVLLEGRLLHSGEIGIVISRPNKERMSEELGYDIKVGDNLMLTGMSNAGPKIREVPIVGIFEFSDSGDDMNFMSFIDIQTLRALKGLNLSAAENVEIDEDKVALISAIDADSSIDDLFNNDDLFAVEEIGDVGFDEEELFSIFEDKGEDVVVDDSSQEEYQFSDIEKEMIEQFKFADISSLLRDKGPREFILLKLKKGRSRSVFILRLNRWFQKEGLSVTAGNWKKAAGPFAGMADLVVILYYIAIMLVVVIAFFIVINTLVISVIQRKREIGTMRAIGARKGFIAKMFMVEIIVISLLFSFLGIIAAMGALFVVSLFQIEAINTLFRVIFNGPVLHPTVTIFQIINTLVIVVGIGVIANIYPLFVAMKIQPVEAMRE